MHVSSYLTRSSNYDSEPRHYAIALGTGNVPVLAGTNLKPRVTVKQNMIRVNDPHNVTQHIMYVVRSVEIYVVWFVHKHRDVLFSWFVHKHHIYLTSDI